MLNQHLAKCTHAVTLTLKQSVWHKTVNGKVHEKLTNERASRTLRHALNRLNRQLYGNGFKRKPHTHKLFVIAALEGSRSAKRLHYHLQIGNVPQGVNDQQLANAIQLAWTATTFGYQQQDFKTLRDEGWVRYITKEVGRTDTDCIDWENTHFPE